MTSLFVILFSCQESKSNHEYDRSDKTVDKFLEFDLDKMGESLLSHTYVDRIRIIQYNPFGMKTYIVNVGKYEEGYSISSKEVTSSEIGYDYISHATTRKFQIYDYIWSNAVKKLAGLEYKKIGSRAIGDQAIAMIEFNIGGVYKVGDFIFCDSTKWIADMMFDLSGGDIQLIIPHCAKVIKTQ